MFSETASSIEIFRFTNLSQYPQIKHFVSTRKGGISKPPFDSLNISFSVCGVSENVVENRKRLSDAVGISVESFVFCKQVHSGNVFAVIGQQRGKGMSTQDAIQDTDALITNESNLALTVLVADCVPILLYDPIKNTVGAVHSGWKGTVAKILTNTVNKMREDFGTDPKDLIVGIGPAIGPKSYEVDTSIIKAFEETFPQNHFIRMKDRTHGMLNLWEANKLQLLQCEVLENNIEVAGIDTFRDINNFFSARRKRPTGHFAAGIMIN